MPLLLPCVILLKGIVNPMQLTITLYYKGKERRSQLKRKDLPYLAIEYQEILEKYPSSEFPVADYCIELVEVDKVTKKELRIYDTPDYSNYRMLVQNVHEYARWRQNELEQLKIVNKRNRRSRIE